SVLSGAHTTLVPEVVQELRARGMDEVLVVVGGIIPQSDVEALQAAGVAAVFPPGANISTIVEFIKDNAPNVLQGS
ncbi:MAG: methylmalonyl-CoA mutase, partial [Myxococcota bacterium]|nr:methylmalonyl-CoA mutase [Myxococcota bacterium]